MSTSTTKKIVTNQFQAQAEIERLILGGLSHDKVYHEVRANTALKDSIQRNSSIAEFRKAVESFAENFNSRLEEARRRGPLVEAHVKLQARAGALVGELIAKMTALSLEDPADIRDAVGIVAALEGASERGDLATIIKNALEYLDTAEVDVKDLEHEFLALFPVRVKSE